MNDRFMDLDTRLDLEMVDVGVQGVPRDDLLRRGYVAIGLGGDYMGRVIRLAGVPGHIVVYYERTIGPFYNYRQGIIKQARE